MRKIFYLAPVMSLALIVGVSLQTQAKPPNEVITTYYSDASHKKFVGEKTLHCGGGITLLGEETKFYTRESFPCD